MNKTTLNVGDLIFVKSLTSLTSYDVSLEPGILLSIEKMPYWRYLGYISNYIEKLKFRDETLFKDINVYNVLTSNLSLISIFSNQLVVV